MPSIQEIRAMAEAEDKKEAENIAAMHEWHNSAEYKAMLAEAQKSEENGAKIRVKVKG